MMGQAISANAMNHWHLANQQYLHSQMLRLRLLLNRRILWLRKQWKEDSLQHQGLVISDAKADSLLAGEDSHAEAVFYASDSKAAAIGRSLAEIDQELSRQLQSLSQAGQAPALELLAHLLGLTRFERDALLLCVAPELDPSFEKLYAYVQDDVTRKYATPHLALSLFADEEWATARESLMPGGALRRLRLVTLDPGPLPSTASGSCPLRPTERVIEYVIGMNRIDEQVARLLWPVPSAPLAPHHNDLIDRLHGYMRERTPWPAINIIGPAGAGKSALARALCDRLNMRLFRLEASQIPASGVERYETLRLLEREATFSQFGVYLDITSMDEAASLTSASVVGDFIRQLNAFLIVGSRDRLQTQREVVMVQMPKLDTTQQRGLWQQALRGVPHSLNGEIESLVQQFDFGPTPISQAIAAAQGRANLRAPSGDTNLQADDLWQACREQAGWHLDQLAQQINPCHTWDDIVLPEDVYCQLKDIAAQVANRSQVYEEWGFGAKLNRGRGISALFSGPSGSGKTLAAEILANHLNLSLYRIDLSGVVSKYIGETEKNLRRVFDSAEQTGAILFFDEADALFGKRSEVKDSHDRYANIEVNYLLQRMEEYRGLAILATNMKSYLDQAFMRRLRFQVDFPFPDASHRATIWRKVFPEKAAVEGVDSAALSRLEISGGNIKNIAVNAAFLAASDGVAIRMEHVLRAARREYAKIDKLILESEFGAYYSAVKQ